MQNAYNAEIASSKSAAYQIEPWTSVVFMFEMDHECKVILSLLVIKEILWMDRREIQSVYRKIAANEEEFTHWLVD